MGQYLLSLTCVGRPLEGIMATTNPSSFTALLNSTTALGEGLALSAAQEVLTSLTEGPFPSEYMLGVGYAGWGPEQLDKEIEQESWWIADLDPLEVIRSSCDTRWDLVMTQLGFNKSPYFCSTAKA